MLLLLPIVCNLSCYAYFCQADSVTCLPPLGRRISFTFELTALKVEKKEQRRGTFLRFVTRSAAVIGGLFTVAGILDSILFHSSKYLHKVRQGKAA